jgi:hypothetical protein
MVEVVRVEGIPERPFGQSEARPIVHRVLGRLQAFGSRQTGVHRRSARVRRLGVLAADCLLPTADLLARVRDERNSGALPLRGAVTFG